MSNTERHIILASGSPRRRELLEQIGFDVVVHRADVPEIPGDGEGAAAYTRRLALEKATAVADRLEEGGPRWILAADTTVLHDSVILEKPVDADDAAAMLARLSGGAHEVITSFCWLDRESRRFDVRSVATSVHFRQLDEDWIRRYVTTGEPMDKAGAYGIQGIGAALVTAIQGSYSSVVGLPVCEVVQALEELGGLTTYPFEEKR